MNRIARAFKLVSLAAMPALAAAAPIEGTVTLDGQPIAIGHVLARLHDNAEGVIGKPLLIVVSDRPVPPGALDGLGEPAVSSLALAGKLRGLLIRIDPAKPYEASLVVLDKPAEAGRGLASVFVGAKEQPAIEGLVVGAGKVAGTFRRPVGGAQAIDLTFAFRIDTALTREPAVTADLKGAAMHSSAPYRAAVAYAEAMQKGDRAAQDRLVSRALRERMAGYPDQAAITERLKAVGATMKTTQLPKVHRLVERGSRATLLIDSRAWITMVREDGEWKSGD